MSETEATLYPDLPLPAPEAQDPALTAAAVAIHDADCPDRTCSGSALGHCYKLARAALGAAAPVIKAQALLELAADLRATARAPGLPQREKGLEFAANLAEKEAAKP